MLFERLFPTLRPGIRRRLAPALRAKVGESDLIQSAYASVVRRLDDFSDAGPGSFRRWLASILDHKVIDAIRRHRGRGRRERGREIELDDLSEHSTPRENGDTPSRAAAAREDRRRIRAAVELLGQDQRTIVTLIHEKSLSMEQAATAMQRTPEAVRKLYARAVDRLATMLSKSKERDE